MRFRLVFTSVGAGLALSVLVALLFGCAGAAPGDEATASAKAPDLRAAVVAWEPPACATRTFRTQEKISCTGVPPGGHCDDGDPCTVGEFCTSAGECKGGTLICVSCNTNVDCCPIMTYCHPDKKFGEFVDMPYASCNLETHTCNAVITDDCPDGCMHGACKVN